MLTHIELWSAGEICRKRCPYLKAGVLCCADIGQIEVASFLVAIIDFD